jgi:hypothetical protein
MDKPTPDGKVVIEFMDGHERVWLMEEIKSHTFTHGFYVVYLDNPASGRVEYPIQHVRYLHITYNSDQYLEELRKWSDETHQEHLDTKRDLSCIHCKDDQLREVQAARELF